MAATKPDCDCIECERCLDLLAIAWAAEEWVYGRITDEQLRAVVKATWPADEDPARISGKAVTT